MNFEKKPGTNDMTLRDALAVTPDCPPLSALLDQVLSPAMESHVSQCPRCRTELALFSEMGQTADQPAVQAISKRLAQVNWAEAGRTGIPSQPESLWQRLLRPRFLAPASLAFASVLVMVALVQVNRPVNRPDLRGEDGTRLESQQYRSQQLRGLSPLGPVDSVPKDLRWEKVSGAAEYEVRLMEVDHTNIWQSRVSEERVMLPSEAVSKILPGKRLLWDVKAFGKDGKEISGSETFEFTTSLR